MSMPHEESDQEKAEKEGERLAKEEHAMGKEKDTYPDIDEPAIPPGAGGYEGRNPATDMPRMPSAPETQDDD